MTAAPTPSKLWPFTQDPAWIGGDIRGLSALAGELYGYAPKIDGVAGTLDGQVSRMVSAAGWQGSGASAFTSSWGKDSLTAEEIAVMAVGIGQIVDELAVSLSKYESGLETEAEFARNHGVTIGPQGQPPEITATSSSYAIAYQGAYEGLRQEADTARENAVSELVLYNGPNHSLANKVVGVAGLLAAEYGAYKIGALNIDVLLASGRAGGEAAETLADAVLPVDSGIAAVAESGAILAGSTLGFVAIPLAVGFVGYGVGVLAASVLEGKGWQSFDIAGDALTDPFKAAATGIGHMADDLWHGIGL